MVKPSLNRPARLLGAFVLAALTGWAFMMVIEAMYVFVLPHGPGFAPEIGPFASFLFFAATLSGYYLLGFVAITVPAALTCRLRFPRLSMWRWSFLGGILFSGAILLGQVATLQSDTYEILFTTLLAFFAGFGSFLPLAPARVSTI